MQEIEATYVSDDKCTKLLQELAITAEANPNYKLVAGILRYKGRIVLGNYTDLKEKVFNSFHGSIFGGHSGSRVTYHRIKKLFFWPHMKEYIANKIAECPIC